MMKKIKTFFRNLFVTKKDSKLWMVSSLVLFAAVAFLGVYSFSPDFNRSVNALLWGTQTAETRTKLFKLPVTVVINEKSEDQKMRMEQFLANMADPQQALIDTELEPKWLDANTPEARQLIQHSGLKYLPQIFVDVSIEQHPQFQAMQQYLTKSGDIYYIRLAPLEHLSVPPYTDGQVAGMDPAQAKVVIQAYESFSCSHCAETRETLNRIVREYPSDVSVVYKFFEPGDAYVRIAEGAACAADQDKFERMQELMFKGQTDVLAKLPTFTNEEDALAYVHDTLLGYARTAGLDTTVFKSCLDERAHAIAIEKQTLDAIDYGVNGPPSFFINERFQSGLLSYDEMKTMIEEELAQ